jgi:hypothetical protein
MTAPWGLLGRAAGRPDPFVDATVATAFLSPELQDVPIPTSVTWTGTLLAPRDGLYRMAFAAEDPMSLELDGSPLSIATVGPDAWSNVGEGTPVMLAAGPHRVQVTQQVTHGGRNLARWNWVPPRADGTLDQRTPWTVVPPSVLRPDSDF